VAMAKRRKSSKASSSSLFSFKSETIHWQSGDATKADPFFILVINNIALEKPFGSKNFVSDMSTGSKADRARFANAAEYIKKNLFGELKGQREKLLADSPHSSKIKFWSMYVWDLPVNSASSLVGEFDLSLSEAIKPRQDAVVSMLAHVSLNPDIVYIVTKSTYYRATAIPTTDDDTRGGIAATHDGKKITHCYYNKIPGMVAINVVNDTMTPAHEFGHAFSSFTNGHIVDLYVDNDIGVQAHRKPRIPGNFALNKKFGRPIPKRFAKYQGKNRNSDKTRNSLGYEAGWASYHPELADQDQPAVMDDYHNTTEPMSCLHDKLTKAYIMDKIVAKVSR
jgi:hypothetical protein